MKLADIPLYRVTVPELHAYGLSRGWQIARERSTYKIWTDGAQEFMVPSTVINEEAYAEALQSLVLKVSRLEQRGPDDVALELLSVGSDRVNLSLSSRSLYPGTVKLRDGVALIEGALEFYRAAVETKTGVAPGRRGRKGGAVDSFLDGLVLGPSEPSSYSVWILCRVIDFSSDLLVKGKVDEFSRQVTRKMYDDLSFVRLVVAEFIEGKQADFEAAAERLVEAGIRPFLCESLAEIGASEIFDCLNLRVEWSSLAVDETLPSKPIEFVSTYVPYLKHITKVMKKRLHVQSIKLFGNVERLNKREGQQKGKVALRVSLPRECEGLLVSFVLFGKSYHDAVVAHDQGLLVCATGELDRSAETGKMRVESFEVVKGVGPAA